MRKLLRYLAPYMLFTILAPLFMFMEVLIDLYLPTLMARIVNIGIHNNDLDYVLRTGGLMIALSLLGIIGGGCCVYFSSKASQRFGRDLRAMLFEKVQQFSFANLDKFTTASLITRLTNDINQISQIVLMSLRMMVRSPLLFIGGIFMAYSLNSNLSVILLVAVPLLIATLVFIMKRAFPFFTIVQERIDKMNLVMRENLTGVRVVKAFNRQELEIEKFKTANLDLRNIIISAFKIISLIFPLMMTIMNFAVILVLWYGGNLSTNGKVSSGDLMAYVNYMFQILMALMMLGMTLMNISRGMASAARINEVLETEVDIVDSGNAKTLLKQGGDVEFKDVSFRYPGSDGDDVLSHINFKAKSGQTIGILGETGAGKSSFVHLIPRLYDVTGGQVLVDGIEVRDYNLEELRKKIGIVLQQSVLFSGTIRDNIKWGNPNATDEEIEEVCKTASAHDFILEQENGYDTDVSQMGVNLSGGQKQRLSIARALLKKPDILIFDDSTSAVDLATESRIQKALREQLADCTKIIIAQRISSVIDSDEIIVIHGGEIAACGTHDELINTSSIYQDIYYSQRNENGGLNE